MICDDLASTGSDLPVVLILFGALGLIVLGLIALRHRLRAALVVVLIVGVAGLVAAAPAAPAYAACSAAPTEGNSLTITQTSVNVGLSPTEAPSLIVGRVTNNGPDDTFLTAIVVSIGSIVKATGAMPGTCDASDYVLVDPRMAVGVQLAPDGGSAEFSGARIGFNDKSTNQDACKGATVELHYVAE
jgi:hypothetical protein